MGSIFSGIKSLGELLIKALAKKYLDQPHLYIILNKTGGGGKSHMGFSDKNEIIDGVLPVTPSTIQISKITTAFKMTLRNNSEYSAYNIRLLQPEVTGGFTIKPKIDPFKSIIVNGFEEYTIFIEWIYEGTGMDAYNLYERGSDFFTKNKIVLEYTNVKKTKFFTEFDINKIEAERNTFHRKNPLSDIVKI